MMYTSCMARENFKMNKCLTSWRRQLILGMESASRVQDVSGIQKQEERYFC